jgi:hypothetical protein
MWDIFISLIVREVFHLSERGGTFYNLFVVDNSHLFSIIFVRGNENDKNKEGNVNLFINFF